MARGNPSRSGWLDEFWTLVLVLPYVLAFIPATQDTVSRGFVIMTASVPGWYQAGIATAIAWGFAMPRLQGLMKSRR